jgi:multiple sugar transport system substrate-binding protein
MKTQPPISPTRRAFLRGMLSAAAAAGLAGCGSRPKDPPGVVTLDFYNYATPEFLALYNEKLIPAFEQRRPHIKIRMNSSLGDAGYDAKLLTLIAGKMAPDLFHVTQQNFPFYAAKDVILPIDDFLRRDGELSGGAFYPQVTDGMRHKGRLLGLPSDFSTIVMLYNQDLFDRFGVAYPEPDWTWDDYLRITRALTRDTDRDGHTDVYGTVNPSSYNRWPAWVWMNGGDLFTPDLKRCTLDSPASVEGLRYYVDLSLTHKVAPTPAQSLGQDFEDLFTSQMAAIIPDSRFAYKRFLRKRGLKFRWDLAPMPRGRTRATTFIWGGNCILKSTRRPQEAWEFLKFLSGPEGAAINLEAGNALPAYRPAAEAEVKSPSDPRTPRHDRYFIEAVSYGRTAPFPPQYAEYSQAMSGLQDAFLGLKPVETACKDFADEVNTMLGAGVF